MLEDLGHTVIRANSGKRALEILDAEQAIDLIMTDQAMPGMSGIELAELARLKRPQCPFFWRRGTRSYPPGRKQLFRVYQNRINRHNCRRRSTDCWGTRDQTQPVKVVDPTVTADAPRPPPPRSSNDRVHGVHPLASHLKQLLAKLVRRVRLFRKLHAVLSVLLKYLCCSGRHGTSLQRVPFVNAFCGTEFQLKFQYDFSTCTHKKTG